MIELSNDRKKDRRSKGYYDYDIADISRERQPTLPLGRKEKRG